jgi:hypothetical protein
MEDVKKLVLAAEPTFETKGVKIPRPGLSPVSIDVKWKFFERADYLALIKSMPDVPLENLLWELMVGWGEQVAEPYGNDALVRLCRSFPRAPRVLLSAFEEELFGLAEKN